MTNRFLLLAAVALLLVSAPALSAAPSRVLVVPASGGLERCLAEHSVGWYGRTGNWFLVEPDAAPTLSARGFSHRLLATDPDLPLYLVLPQAPGARARLAAFGPLLLEDRDAVLMQLDPKTASRVSLSGCQLFRLPDRPSALPPSASPLLPRAALTDTFVQRVVSRVSPDSVRAHIQRLEDFRTRYSPADSCRAAEQYCYDYFTALGLDSVDFFEYVAEEDTWRNVIGTIRGSAAPGISVIVCGHLDATSEDPWNHAPGAEDNASGTAMALEAARVLAGEELGMTVRFIAFTGEEQGIYGSFYYAATMRALNAEIAAALNFDMIAWPGGQFGVLIYTDSASLPLAEFEDQMAETYTALDHEVHVGQYGSDQLAFQYFGYPSTAGAEYGNFFPYYHTTADTIGNLSMDLAAEVARMAVATAATIATAPAPPSGFRLLDAGTGGSLEAAWSPNPEPDIAGYKLLWGTEERTYTDSVVLGLVTVHRITGLANGTRYYATVTALDSTGHESGPARERSAVPGFMPLPPAGVSALPRPQEVAVSWNRNLELDLAGYNVYRSTVPDAGFVRLNASPRPDTTYGDTAVAADTMYYYYVTAEDTSGIESDSSAIVRSKPGTFDHGILLVDETRDGSGAPGNPSDAQQDDFYHRLLQGYRFTDWDVARQGTPAAGDMGPYSTVVWHGDDYQNQRLHGAIPDLVHMMDLGVNLWLVGWKPVYAIENNIGSYPYDFEPGTFGADYLRLARAEQSQQSDFTGAAGLAGYPAVEIDSTKTLSALHGRLPFIDALLPHDADTVLTYNSFSGDTFQDKPVGIRWLGSPFRVVFMGFPLYYAREEDAVPLARKVLEDLGEPYAVAEPRPVLPGAVSLGAWPSPARRSTVVRFSLPARAAVRLGIYDVAGTLVRRLLAEERHAGRHAVAWDGRDERGTPVSSGTYFCRLDTGEQAVTGKVQFSR